MKWIWAAVLLVTAGAWAADKADHARFELKVAADVPVITLDYQGSRLRRIDDRPTLAIFSDGSIVMPKSYSVSMGFQGQITPAELQDLLAFIVDQNRFFQFDEKAAKAAIAALPYRERVLPGHLGTTVISVDTGTESRTISFFALGEGPHVNQLDGLIAIKNRLDLVMSVVELGGQSGVQQWVDVANHQLLAENPDAKLLTAADLESGTHRTDGSIGATFSRPEGSRNLLVTVAVGADGTRTVTKARVARSER